MEKQSPRILLVVTSHDRLGDTGEKTGFWLEELAVPYRTLLEAGAKLDIASPKGGKPPADPKSSGDASAEVRAFLSDAEANAKLESTKRIADLAPEYDAVFVAGGHGVMWDLATSKDLASLLSRTFEKGGVVAAVCHGPAALVPVVLSDGKPLVAGRRVAGFSNEEEKAAELDRIVPFMLESKLVELGGKYEHGPMWKSFAVRDGRLVTGQNPASSAAVAKEVLASLREIGRA